MTGCVNETIPDESDGSARAMLAGDSVDDGGVRTELGADAAHDAQSASSSQDAAQDGQASQDARVAVNDASAQCDPAPDTYQLLAFDTEGPTSLLDGANEPRELVGFVMQEVQGLPAESIPDGSARPQRPEQFRVLRVLGDGHAWVIAVRDIPSFGVHIGDAVTVELRHHWGGFSPDLASLSIRVSGQLAFFYGLGGAVTSMTPPSELTVEQGAALCMRQSTCGDWAVYALRVRDTASGTVSELEPDARGSVGAFEVIHGGDSQQLPSPHGTCPDWFVSRSQLIAYRHEPSSSAGCRQTAASSLPGVRIEFPTDAACRFSLSQAAAGIEIPYTLVVDADVPNVVRGHTAVSACTPRDLLPADLFTDEELSGNGQQYALRSQGLCPTPDLTPITLAAGRHAHVFRWDGVNWMGPSDTSQPKGPPFPAGTYTLKVRADGSVPATSGAATRPLEVLGTLQVTLTP
jgi:hypothetical protein